MYISHIPPNCPNYNECTPRSYTQCRMSKAGMHDMVSWIPTEFAVLGKKLKLRFDSWDSGWVVISVGNAKFGYDYNPNLMDGFGNDYI